MTANDPVRLRGHHVEVFMQYALSECWSGRHDPGLLKLDDVHPDAARYIDAQVQVYHKARQISRERYGDVMTERINRLWDRLLMTHDQVEIVDGLDDVCRECPIARPFCGDTEGDDAFLQRFGLEKGRRYDVSTLRESLALYAQSLVPPMMRFDI